MNETFNYNQPLLSIQTTSDHSTAISSSSSSNHNATATAAALTTLDALSSNLTTSDVVHLSNILNDYLFHPIIVILLCLLSVFVVLGNLLVVTAIWHESQLHSVTNYLIASLAAADCLVGAIVMPSSIITEIILGSWIFGPIWCDLWHSFDVLASTASIMNLCAISLDRYLAITDPISYPSRMTPKRVALLIVFLWTCSSMISFPAIIWWHAVGQESLQQIKPLPPPLPSSTTSMLSPTTTAKPESGDVVHYKCVFPDDTYYLLFSSFVSFYGPLCIMLYAYYRIYKAAIKQTRFLKHGSKQVMIDGNNKRNKRFRHVSEHFSCGTSERYGFSSGSVGTAPVDSYDRQHLVLRAHRGGSSNSTGGGGSSNNNNSHQLCGGSVRLAGNNSAINFNTSPATAAAIRAQASITSVTNANSAESTITTSTAAAATTVTINSASHSAGSPNCVRNNNNSNNNDNLEPNIEPNCVTTDNSKHKQRNLSNCIKDENSTTSNTDEKLSTSLSTSSGSYGTGSIVSVLVRPNPPAGASAAGTAIATATTPPINAAATMVVTTNINGTGTAVTTTKTTNTNKIGPNVKNSVSILNDKFSHSPKRQIPNSTDHADQSAQLLRNEAAQHLHQNSANHSPNMSNSIRQNHQQRTVGKKLTKLAKERKAAKTLGIVVGVFILCWLPFFVANIIIALCGIDCLFKPHILLSIVTWLGWLNSAMNPVIYACWSRDFRRAFRRVLLTWLKFVCPYFLSDR